MIQGAPCVRRLTATIVMLTACGTVPTEAPAGISCTRQLVFGINVIVRDSVSDALIGSGTTVVAIALNARDSVSVPANTPSMDDFVFRLFPERAGTYSVGIQRQGYVTWGRHSIVVAKDACHVIPVSITARLVRLY